MLNKNRRRNPFFPIVIVFVALSGLFVSGKSWMHRWGADQEVLIIGNLVLFLITLLSFFLTQRGLKSTNTAAFIRGVYSGIMLKLFLCVIAAFIYIAATKTSVNKPALFTLMALYLVYTFLEVTSLTKMLRGKTHG